MAYLAEHQSATSDIQERVTQSQEEEATVLMVENLFQKAKRSKEPYSRDWPDYYKMVIGKQWKNQRPEYRHSEVLNLIHSAIQVIIPILTDNRPNIDVAPVEPSDFEFSEILSQILTTKWDQKQWAEKVGWAIFDACTYGTAIGEVCWNPDDLHGIGDFNFEITDPFQFFVDPEAIDINHPSCNYVIEAKPTPLAELKREFPDKAHLIGSDVIRVGASKDLYQETLEMKVTSPIDNRVQVPGETGVGVNGAEDMSLKITCYLKDQSIEEYEITKSNGDKETKQRKRYPKGRKIIVAGGILLYDSAPEVGFGYIDNKFPFAKLVDHLMPREFWGQGEVKQLMGPQVMINKLISYMMDVLILTGNPIWVVSTDSGINTDNLFNAPGLIVEKNPGSEVRREEGVHLQPYIMQMFQLLQGQFEKISGINEVSQGIRPANASGIAIDLLQEASQTKLRLKARNLELFLKQIGQLMVSRILQFYSIPRIERITGKDGVERYFRFAVDSIADEAGDIQHKAVMQEIVRDPMSGAVTEQAPIEYDIKGELDVVVNTGSMLPFKKAERERQADKWLQIGLIDVEDYAEMTQIPNKEKIIEKFKQRQQAAAAMPPQQQGA